MSHHARFRPFLALLFACAALAQVPAARAQAQDAGAALDPAYLEELVGPIALYPDDLLSITLPAATYPLQVVQADRWVQQNKGKKDAKPNDSWDDSVKALINYPDVVSKLSNDLEWTAALGEAVVADQTAVMDAVQSFRRKANGAGNLRTDEKQTVEVEEEIVKIVQTDPEVIYVPQYEPTTVVVQQSTPYYYPYYPTAYPCYYCYYPPGYAFASGFFWGAATAWAFNWFDGGIHNDIDIDIDRDVDRNRDVNRDRNTDRSRNTDRGRTGDRATNIDRGRANQMKQNKQGGWKSGQRPGQVSRGGQARATAGNTGRVGDRAGASNRAGAGASNRATASNRAGTGAANRAGSAGAGNRATAGTGSRQSGSLGSAGGSRSGASSRGGSSGGISLPSSMQGNRSSSYGGRSSYGGSGNYGNASRYSGSARSSSPSRSSYSGMSSGRSASSYSSRGASSRGSMGGGSRGGGGGGRRR